ncbi:MAG: beta-galactosidase [Oscillospiraceae bacterium]|nr:beta-galactosidase [Oscillospiraceae bacterium]
MTILNGERMVLGTCYYPEHWPQKLWREDLCRMLEAGIEVIRIAEFAWSKTEPREGEFTFDFFDSFLDLCEEVGMKVIFCTPTPTPPAWLTEKYPETLNCTLDGLPYHHGNRQQCTYNAPMYRKLSARITEKLGEHYAKRPCIIGWQLDNEFNCGFSEYYSEADDIAFRAFVREKYGTLDALNEAWGTSFWNQTYTDWAEVHQPRRVPGDSPNPHMMLDYSRFISASARSFAHMESEILRKYLKPGDFITHNGLFDNIDYQAFAAESLDFMTHDVYPNFAYEMGRDLSDPEDLLDRKWSRHLTEVRAVSPVFGIMEQQSGANGWNTRMEAPSPRPGQMTLWTMQSIAHGADYVSYFRWRTCTMGTEMYWHGLLDYSGRENRRMGELRKIRDMVKKLAPAAGGIYKAEAAVLKDYDNIWDARYDVWHGRVEEASRNGLFAASQLTHTPLDYVYLDYADIETLRRYKVLFYPHATILTPERIALLTEYVRGGGKLVFGCRTGYKDLTGRCVMDKLPGLAAELTGTDIPEYTFIGPDSEGVTVNWDGTEFSASVFADQLEPLDGAVCEARFTSEYFAGAGALISHKVGEGTAYYYGSAFNRESAAVFFEKLGVLSPWKEYVTLPEGCELAVREKDGRKFAFILNYQKGPAEIDFVRPALNLETGETLSGGYTLPPLGTVVAEL